MRFSTVLIALAAATTFVSAVAIGPALEDLATDATSTSIDVAPPSTSSIAINSDVDDPASGTTAALLNITSILNDGSAFNITAPLADILTPSNPPTTADTSDAAINCCGMVIYGPERIGICINADVQCHELPDKMSSIRMEKRCVMWTFTKGGCKFGDGTFNGMFAGSGLGYANPDSIAYVARPL